MMQMLKPRIEFSMVSINLFWVRILETNLLHVKS